MSYANNKEKIIANRVKKRLCSSSGAISIEFALMLPLFLYSTIFMFDFLNTLPKMQQAEIVARYIADGGGHRVDNNVLLGNALQYIQSLKVGSLTTINTNSQIDRDGYRFLFSQFNMWIDGIFDTGSGKVWNFFLKLIKKLLNILFDIASFGIYTPYVKSPLNMDRCYSVQVEAEFNRLFPDNANLFGFGSLPQKRPSVYRTNMYAMPVGDTGNIHKNYTLFDYLCNWGLTKLSWRDF